MNELLLPVGLAVAGLVVGYAVGRSGRRDVQRTIDAMSGEMSRLESQTRDQSRMLARLRQEQGSVATLARSLPVVVRELNRADTDPRRIPKLIVQLAKAIFDPDQVLLFIMQGGTDAGHRLHLAASDGLGEISQPARSVDFGDGKIGWVAQNRVEMGRPDWLNLSRTDGQALSDNHPAFKLDLIGPMVHHSHSGDQVLGVLCVGNPGTRPRDEKLMLQLVTNLGSMALMSVYQHAQLRDRADHDGLTGLMNKRAFMKRLGENIVAAENQARPLSVFIFDIDHFKNYNDSNGHLAGDELLKTVARVLRENMRPGDIPCRYGGEEFIVLMPSTNAADAHSAAERIRQSIESFPFPHEASQPGNTLTISGGVAAYPVDGTNGTELIGHADQALYQAKAAGRNRVLRYRGVEIGGSYDEQHDPDDPTVPGIALEQ